MENFLSKEKPQEKNSGFFRTKKINLIFDSRFTFGQILGALKKEFSIKVFKDGVDEVTIILSTKKND